MAVLKKHLPMCLLKNKKTLAAGSTSIHQLRKGLRGSEVENKQWHTNAHALRRVTRVDTGWESEIMETGASAGRNVSMTPIGRKKRRSALNLPRQTGHGGVSCIPALRLTHTLPFKESKGLTGGAGKRRSHTWVASYWNSASPPCCYVCRDQRSSLYSLSHTAISQTLSCVT